MIKRRAIMLFEQGLLLAVIAGIFLASVVYFFGGFNTLLNRTSTVVTDQGQAKGAINDSTYAAPVSGINLVLEGDGTLFHSPNGVSPGPARNFVLRNAGTDLATVANTITLTGPNANRFRITATNCTVLGLRSSCAITVAPIPQTDGAYSATLSVNAFNAPSLPLSGIASGFTQPMAWSGSGSGWTVTSPTPGATRAFTLTHQGTQPITNLAVSLTGTNASTFEIVSNNCPTSFAVGGTCTVNIRPLGTSPATYSATLTAQGTNATAVNIALSGTATTPTANLAFSGSGTGIDITNPASVPANSNTRVITLTNTGNATLPSAPTFSFTGTDASTFSVQSHTCGALTQGANCTVSVRATRSTGGSYTANIVATAGSITTSMGLSGTASGFNASLAWSGGGLFSITSPSSSPAFSNTQTYTLTNSGSGSVSNVPIQLSGTNPSNFQITTNTCTSATLNPGGNCQVQVQMLSSTSGNFNASLVAASTNNPSITLSGSASGFNPAYSWRAAPSGTTTITTAPNAEALWPTTPATMTALSVRLFNGGTGAGTLPANAISITNGTITSDGCSGQTLGVNQACTVSYRLPNSIAISPNTVNGSLTHSTAGSLSFTSRYRATQFAFTNNGQTLNTTSLPGPTRLITLTASQVFPTTINASTAAPVTITDPSNAYQIVSNTCTNAQSLTSAAPTCQIGVRLRTGISPGSYNISFATNTTFGPQVNLTETGVLSASGSNSNIVYYGTNSIGILNEWYTVQDFQVQAQNQGPDPAPVSVTMTGNPLSFSILSNTCPATLAVWADCFINMRMVWRSGQGTQTYTTSVSVTPGGATRTITGTQQ